SELKHSRLPSALGATRPWSLPWLWWICRGRLPSRSIVVADLEIPTGFRLPSRLCDRAAKGVDAPRHLGVGHESGGLRIDVAGEGSREFDLVKKQITVLGRQNRRHRRAGRRIGDQRINRLAH